MILVIILTGFPRPGLQPGPQYQDGSPLGGIQEAH